MRNNIRFEVFHSARRLSKGILLGLRSFQLPRNHDDAFQRRFRAYHSRNGLSESRLRLFPELCPSP